MFRFLINNRLAPSGARETARTWAKRVYTLPELLVFRWRILILESRGAKIHPSAVLSLPDVQGSAANLTIGAHTSMGRATIRCVAPVTIEDCVVINDGVRILTGSHDIDSPDYGFIRQPIVIRRYAWIASGAMVLQGVTIGEGAVIGAGSVVTKDVAPRAVVAGNPARVIRERKDVAFRYLPSSWFAAIQAWVGRT